MSRGCDRDVPVGVTLSIGVRVLVGVTLGVGVRVLVGVPINVTRGVGVGVVVLVAVPDGVVVSVGVLVSVAVSVGVAAVDCTLKLTLANCGRHCETLTLTTIGVFATYPAGTVNSTE
jgi:hypothetical protein